MNVLVVVINSVIEVVFLCLYFFVKMVKIRNIGIEQDNINVVIILGGMFILIVVLSVINSIVKVGFMISLVNVMWMVIDRFLFSLMLVSDLFIKNSVILVVVDLSSLVV